MPRMHKDLWVLFCSQFLFAMGMGLYSVIMPAYIRGLGASSVELGLVGSIALGMSTLSAIPGGLLADRVESRLLMLLGWSMCIPAPLVFAYATHWTGLIPGYFLFNFSMFCIPATQAYVVAKSTAQNRSLAFTMVFVSAYAIGMVFSPALGGYVAERHSITSVFWISFVFYLLSTLILLLASRSYPIKERYSKGKFSLRSFPRQFWLMVPMFAVGSFVVNLPLSFTTPFLQDVAGMDLFAIGLLGSVVALGGALLSPLMGKTADRLGVIRVLGLGFLILAVGFIGQLAFPVFGVLLVVFFTRGGAGAVMSLMTSAISEVARPEAMGMTFAVYNLLAGMAGTAAPYTAGWLYDRGPSLPFILTAGLAIFLGGAFYLRGRVAMGIQDSAFNTQRMLDRN